MGQLKANNIDVKHENNDSNIVVVNTCGFIDNEKEESINTILEQILEKKMEKLKNYLSQVVYLKDINLIWKKK